MNKKEDPFLLLKTDTLIRTKNFRFLLVELKETDIREIFIL